MTAAEGVDARPRRVVGVGHAVVREVARVGKARENLLVASARGDVDVEEGQGDLLPLGVAVPRSPRPPEEENSIPDPPAREESGVAPPVQATHDRHSGREAVRLLPRVPVSVVAAQGGLRPILVPPALPVPRERQTERNEVLLPLPSSRGPRAKPPAA